MKIFIRPKSPIYHETRSGYVFLGSLILLLASWVHLAFAILAVTVATYLVVTELITMRSNNRKYRKWQSENEHYCYVKKHSYPIGPDDDIEIEIERILMIDWVGENENRFRFLNRDEEILYLLQTGNEDRHSCK